MKIGLVTFHHARQSYGAILQTYATLMALRKMGHEVELINYENTFEQSDLKWDSLSVKDRCIRFANWFARMYLFDGHKNPYLKKKNLDAFYGQMTPLMHTKDQLDTLKYDVLVVGSDQVWNPDITGGCDAAFLLNFGKAKRRFSYASSMGSRVLDAEEQAFYKECLSRFDAISVREKFAADQLSEVAGRDVDVVVDPTLLFDKQEWCQMLDIRQTPPEEPYILTYFIGTNLENNWNDIAPYVKALGLPVYNVQTHARKSEHMDKALYAMTIKELVEKIAGASLVITDSFHGTAFSVNFQKNIISVPNKNNPLRVQNFLESVGMEEYILPQTDVVHEPYDYTQIQAKLDDYRQQSKNWLQNAVGK